MAKTEQNTVDNTEDKKWWVNEDGDLMWRAESPGPEWQFGMEWNVSAKTTFVNTTDSTC